jgi:hypothetical protein
MSGAGPHLVAATLSGDRIIVAIRNDRTLRTWSVTLESIRSDEHRSVLPWEGGALLSLISPPRAPIGDVVDMNVLQLLAQNHLVGILASVTQGRNQYLGWIASHDDGLTFRGE